MCVKRDLRDSLCARQKGSNPVCYEEAETPVHIPTSLHLMSLASSPRKNYH